MVSTSQPASQITSSSLGPAGESIPTSLLTWSFASAT